MVREEVVDDESAFRCDVCGSHYREESMAELCEAYCEEHDESNPAITARSLEHW